MNHNRKLAGFAGVVAALVVLLTGCFSGGDGEAADTDPRTCAFTEVAHEGELELVDGCGIIECPSVDVWRAGIRTGVLEWCSRYTTSSELHAIDADGTEVLLAAGTDLVLESEVVIEGSDSWAARLILVERQTTDEGITCPRNAVLYGSYASPAADGWQVSYADALASAGWLYDQDHLNWLERGLIPANAAYERGLEELANDAAPQPACRR